MTPKSHARRASLLAVLVVLSAAVGGVAASATTAGTSSVAASVNEAVEYDGTIELALDSNTGSPIQASNVNVWLDGEQQSVSVAEDGTSGRLVLTGLSDVGPSQSLVVDVDQSGDLTTGNVSVTLTGSVLNANQNGNFFPGGTIAYVASAEGVTFDIYRDGDYVVRRSTGSNSKVHVIDTSDQEVGPTYTVDEVDGAQVETKYNLRDLGLTAQANQTSVPGGSSVGVSTTSNGADRPVSFQLVDVDSGDVVETVATRSNGNGEASAAFSPSSGTYEVVVEDTITGITARTNRISVGTTTSGSITVSESVVGDQVGDVVDVVLRFGGETAGGTAGVTLGSSDAGFQVDLDVTDDDADGRAVLHWNTVDATNGTGGLSVSGGSMSSVSVVESLDDPPVPGEYPLSVSTGGSETDIATVLVQDRETSSVSVLTAPGVRSSWSDLDQLGSAVTPSDTVAVDTLSLEHDWVIVKVEATGLEGYVAGAGDVDGSANGLTLAIEEQSETVGQNDDPITFDVSGGSLFAAGDEDTYYVALKTEHRASGVQPGDKFTATFTVDANGNPVTASTEEVSTSFTLVNGTATVDTQDGVVAVAGDSGQSVTGESTFAPGTELTLVARNEGGQSPFVKYDKDVVVDADGSWTAEFDFSDVPDGTSFTVLVKKEGATRVTAEGRVGATDGSGGGSTTATPADDATPTEGDDTGSDATDTPADDDSTPTSDGSDDGDADDSDGTDDSDGSGATPTQTGTPGFGVVVGLLAVLATAMALRRD